MRVNFLKLVSTIAIVLFETDSIGQTPSSLERYLVFNPLMGRDVNWLLLAIQI